MQNLLILVYICHSLEDLVNIFGCFEVLKISSTISADLIKLFYQGKLSLVSLGTCFDDRWSSMFRVLTCLLTFECSSVFISNHSLHNAGTMSQ